MFSASSASTNTQFINFESEENAHKWKNLFLVSLNEVCIINFYSYIIFNLNFTRYNQHVN